IIWDLQPPWKGKKGKACRKEDCDAIRESLDRAGLTAEQLRCVHLVCMEHELETLLLADERAIAAYLSQKKARRCRIKRFRNLAVYTNPKGELHRIFQEHVGRDYVDWEDAIRIIQLADIKEIGRCVSLKRFA